MYENVLKFKPPLAFTRKDADTLVHTVDCGLTEWAAVRTYCVLVFVQCNGRNSKELNEPARHAYGTDREGAAGGQEDRRGLLLLHCGARGLRPAAQQQVIWGGLVVDKEGRKGVGCVCSVDVRQIAGLGEVCVWAGERLLRGKCTYASSEATSVKRNRSGRAWL